MLALSDPVANLGMLWSFGLSLMTSVAAVCCDDMSRFLRSHHSLLIAMVGGVPPATMSLEKATVWPSSAVLLE